MLPVILLAVTSLIVGGSSQSASYDSDDSLFNWNWHSPHNPYLPTFNRRSDDADLFASASSSAVAGSDEKEREPLSPDFTPPSPQRRPSVAQKPSFNAEVLPGGVLDVEAGEGLPGLPGGFPNLGAFGFGFSHAGAGGGANSDSSPEGGGGQHPIDNIFGGLGGLFGGAGGGFGGFGIPEYKPWWRGENVCIDREESTDDEDEDEGIEKQNNTDIEKVPNFFSTSISLSNCNQSPSKYECITKINNHGVVKTFTVRYKCCYGYQRVEGTPGCTKKIDLKSLLETIDDLKGTEFKAMLNNGGLENRLEKENLTIFMPTDMALQDFSDEMNNMNKVDVVRRRRDAVSSSELALNHIVSGFVDISDLENEQLLNTENENKTIRINIYPTYNYDKMITANCARIKKSNNLAKNGIVHIVDKVIVPASQSIQQLIAESSSLTSLRKVFENTNLNELFKEDGHYTIFAPTDAAFDKLDQNTRKKLLEGNSCAGSVVKHHIVSHTVCSSAIVGNATTHNIEGTLLNMERTSDDLLKFEKATIEKPDIIATNGVIHLIDTVIIPDSALYTAEALKSHNLTKFFELVEKADLLDELDTLDNATLFAPSNSAFEDAEGKKVLEELGDDQEKLKNFVRYHTVQRQVESCDLVNNEMMETGVEGEKLRINLYSTMPAIFSNIVNRATANCAKLVNFDEKACGSVIHEVNKVLRPPTATIWEQVQADPDRYSTLIDIMEGTDLAKVLNDSTQAITFAAPDNDAFKSVGEDDLKTLREDKEKATSVLKNHILTEVLCCSGVGPQPWGFSNVVPSLAGQQQYISRNNQHSIRIGRGVVTRCDSVATNGVLHTINRVLFPQRPHPNHFGGFFLFDF